MSEEPTFESFVARLAQGDADASSELFVKYATRLIAVARGRLDSRLKAKVDPEEITQSVFRSFFHRHGAGQFTFADWGGLWGVLVTMTLRKCGRKAEEFRAARRDIRRESAPPENEDGAIWQPAGMDPTPAEATELTDLVERLMATLDERGRQIFSLRLQGYTIPEISEQVGRSERTIHRTLDEIKGWLENQSQELEPNP